MKVLVQPGYEQDSRGGGVLSLRLGLGGETEDVMVCLRRRGLRLKVGWAGWSWSKSAGVDAGVVGVIWNDIFVSYLGTAKSQLVICGKSRSESGAKIVVGVGIGE